MNHALCPAATFQSPVEQDAAWLQSMCTFVVLREKTRGTRWTRLHEFFERIELERLSVKKGDRVRLRLGDKPSDWSFITAIQLRKLKTPKPAICLMVYGVPGTWSRMCCAPCNEDLYVSCWPRPWIFWPRDQRRVSGVLQGAQRKRIPSHAFLGGKLKTSIIMRTSRGGCGYVQGHFQHHNPRKHCSVKDKAWSAVPLV